MHSMSAMSKLKQILMITKFETFDVTLEFFFSILKINNAVTVQIWGDRSLLVC